MLLGKVPINFLFYSGRTRNWIGHQRGYFFGDENVSPKKISGTCWHVKIL